MQQPAKYFYKRLNSTNLYVSDLLAKKTGDQPVWVRTDDQFAGKGQGSRTWLSQPGCNLTGTMAIFPDQVPAARQFVISKLFALTGAALLELYTDEVCIKWPNDLYVGDRKIGGILIESAIMGSLIRHMILGIGLNINQSEFPASLPNPVSLKMITGLDYDLGEMEDLFLNIFVKKYSLLESGNFQAIDEEYISRLYRFGEWADFETADGTFSARITGITEMGKLLLQDREGFTQSFAYQEVEYKI